MSEACCYIEYDLACEPKVYQAKTIKARKEHECCECKRVIKKGEAHEYCSMFYDGWSHYRTCWFCLAIIRDYCGGRRYYEGLAETLWECMGYDLIDDCFDDDDEEETDDDDM